MKTQSINWSVNQSKTKAMSNCLETIRQADTAELRTTLNSRLNTATGHVVRASAATFVVMVILVAAIWAAQNLAASGIIQAMIWSSSFVFLALAVESSNARFPSLLVSGLSLGVLALLSSPQATEFIILAAVLIAAWAAWAILQGSNKG